VLILPIKSLNKVNDIGVLLDMATMLAKSCFLNNGMQQI
jgi:hypothetical protein